MKRIIVDNKVLIIKNNQLLVEKKRLVQLSPKNWIVETHQETLCANLNLNCEACIFLNDKCFYQEWKPGLKKGQEW